MTFQRRVFLKGLMAATVLDPERLLFVPGKKLISIPKPPVKHLYRFAIARLPGDSFYHSFSGGGQYGYPFSLHYGLIWLTAEEAGNPHRIKKDGMYYGIEKYGDPNLTPYKAVVGIGVIRGDDFQRVDLDLSRS